MHTKLLASGRDDTRVLSIKPGWKERLLLPETEWAEAMPHSLFIEMHHDMRGKGVSALYLHVSGMRLLAEILEEGISESLFSTVLLSAADVIGACVCAGVDAGFLYFDASMVYVASDGYPRFAYVPLEGRRSRNDNPPNGHLVGMLSRLSDDMYPACSDRIVHWRRAVSDYCHRSLEYLTLRSYTSLLELTLGLTPFPTTQKAVDLLNRRDPQYVDAPYRRSMRQKAPSQGQWRGVNLRGSFDTFRRDGESPDVIQIDLPSADGPVEVPTYQGPPTVARDDSGGNADLPTMSSEPRFMFVMVRVADGSRFRLEAGRAVRVGRGSVNDIQLLGNPKISREQAVIRCDHGMVSILDMSSANGTWVDGRRLRPQTSAQIAVGQEFSLANERFVIRKGQI